MVKVGCVYTSVVCEIFIFFSQANDLLRSTHNTLRIRLHSIYFRAESLRNDPRALKSWTGFEKFEWVRVSRTCEYILYADAHSIIQLENIRDLVGEEALVRAVRGSKGGVRKAPAVPTKDDYDVDSATAPTTLTSLDYLLLYQIRIRVGLTLEHLASMFGIAPSSACKIMVNLTLFLHPLVRKEIRILKGDELRNHTPRHVSDHFQGDVHLADGSEFKIEKPHHLELQCLSWSEYKGTNTVKSVMFTAGDGFWEFISNWRGGRTSELELWNCDVVPHIVEEVGVCSFLFDKGFVDVDMPEGITNLSPKKVINKAPLSAEDLSHGAKVARGRTTVENAFGRLKKNRYFSQRLSLADLQYFTERLEIQCAFENMFFKGGLRPVLMCV